MGTGEINCEVSGETDSPFIRFTPTSLWNCSCHGGNELDKCDPGTFSNGGFTIEGIPLYPVQYCILVKNISVKSGFKSEEMEYTKYIP